MTRHYQDMLDAAHELQGYGGYLSSAGLNERNQVQARFNAARRAFVYSLFQEGIEKSAIWPSVSADLDAIERANPYSGDALDHVRAELKKHIGGQMRAHPVVRFAIRWGPPAGVAAVTIFYLYQKWQSL